MPKELRWVVVFCTLLVTIYFSLFSASLAGWSFQGTGLDRAREDLPPLVMSAAIGLVGIALARKVLGRKIASFWLLLAFPIPIYFGLTAAGVLP